MGEFVRSGSGDAEDGGNIRYVHHQGQFFQRVILFLLHLVFFLPFWESKLVFEWPRRITQSKFFILFSSRCHGGRTRRLCGADLHGCATGLQNRTPRHDAPHTAEQTAAPTCVSGLCRSSAVSPPPAGGIGVWVLPASAVLISNGDACAFLAQQEKPEVLPVAGIAQKAISIFSFVPDLKFRLSAVGFCSRYNSRYASLKFEFLPCVVANIVAMVFLRRICSSRPGDWEQRRQSLAALTARGRGLDCLQPQPRQPVLRAG